MDAFIGDCIMKTSYIKELATGKILSSTSGQDENNPAHVDSLNNFLSSRGWATVDYEIGFKTDAEVKAMMASAVTPVEAWEKQMAQSDAIPRWFEDYITENSIGLAPGRAKDNYDAKVALRATKPGA